MVDMVKSIAAGAGTVLNLRGSTDNLRLILKSDEEALAGDWKAVGNDIRHQIPEDTQGCKNG